MNIRHKPYVWLLSLFLLLFLAACGQEDPVTVTREVEVEVTREVEVPGPEVVVTEVITVEVMMEPEIPVIPFAAQWLSSAHADASAQAFVHWNEDDPAEVPTRCAKCHSGVGYMDFIGADGSEAGVVDAAAPIGSLVTCEACHNDATVDMTSVTFPSGIEITGLDAEARCIQCHQGRSSSVSVNANIEEAGLTEAVDTTSEDLGFSNIHYYAAAATQFGTLAKGGYEYDGMSYDAKFEHVEGYNTCTSCHDPHTLEIKLDECVACHTDVDTVEDFTDVRMISSLVDYDGDGNMNEGVYDEIEGLRDILYTTMGTYSAEVAGMPIVYDSSSYPYFFADEDGDGAGDARYGNWTARLTKAAYNYQVSLKDPGRFAHGGKYIIQLLYDSIADLNKGLAEPIDISNLRRIDHGHFAGSEQAFRNWDEDGMVPARCSQCHSADGLPLLAQEGVTIAQHPSNGLECATCHTNSDTYERYEFTEVTFPSGATVSFGEEDLDSNLCINCHQGRASSTGVDRAIGDADPDAVTDSLRFQNIHYFAAGATVFGGDVQGAAQYPGKEYIGENEHVGRFNSCTECHNTHTLEVEIEDCANCHEDVDLNTAEDLALIRVSEIDYDGDGDTAEGLAGEIETMYEQLYLALQAYATNNANTDSIVYNSHSYPYFFIDADGDGVAGPDDTGRYGTWTPRLLRGAYNYQYVAKDPGAYAHNGQYVIQILYDAIEDLGGDVSNMTRPVLIAETDG
ncbi:MAG TPA: hypothetical protein VLL52_00025 [Anaerolineae bacterium]|nr:hypothetical protein [Anaerolineae bacterium]